MRLEKGSRHWTIVMGTKKIIFLEIKGRSHVAEYLERFRVANFFY